MSIDIEHFYFAGTSFFIECAKNAASQSSSSKLFKQLYENVLRDQEKHQSEMFSQEVFVSLRRQNTIF